MNDLIINKSTHEITINKKTINPSKRIFDLILFLANNKNRFSSRDYLLNSVWETEFFAPRTVDSIISRARKLLPKGTIESKISVGYRITNCTVEIIEDGSHKELESVAKLERDKNGKRVNTQGIIVGAPYKQGTNLVTVLNIAKCAEYGSMVVYMVNGSPDWETKPVKDFKAKFTSI